MKARIIILALVLGLVALTGCCNCGSCVHDILNPKPQETTISPEVSIPGGGRWKKASIVKSVGQGGRKSKADCTHYLRVDDKSYQIAGAAFDKPAYPALMAANYELVVAPDGHALAFSEDGSQWVVAGLDAGEEVLVAMLQPVSASPADVWSKAPSTGAAAAEFFTAAERGDFDNATGEGLHHKVFDEFRTEVVGAISYACHAPTDNAARAAFSRYALGRFTASAMKNVPSDVIQALADCLGDVALSDPATMATLRGKLVLTTAKGRCPEGRRVTLLALSRGGDAATQDLLATYLTTHRAKYPDCFHKDEAWALGRITTTLGSATPATLDILLEIARDAVPGKYPDGLSGENICSAIRGLAALPKEPRARAVLKKAAKTKGCKDMPDELPPFVHFRWDYSTDFGSSPRCWAGLALESL